MKNLPVQWMSQRTNLLYPYQTCGTTSLSMFLGWINQIYNKTYESNPDKVFEILNSTDMLNRANWLIKNGYPYLKSLLFPTRLGKDGKPSVYTYLNDSMQMLCELGNYITNYEFDFEISYLTSGGIKSEIDNNLPVIIDGVFPATKGHYIVLCSYDDNGNFSADDPYGDYKTNYQTQNGDHVVYSIADIWKYGAKMLSGNKMACVTAKYKGSVLDHDITPVVDPNPNP